MATFEHLSLSSYIKSVHLGLREKSKSFGFEKAWNEHCSDENCLQQYASAMKELATKHWTNSNKNQSRIDWIYHFCQEYFSNIKQQRIKEEEILKKLGFEPEMLKYEKISDCTEKNLLDVGSCYNPFKCYDSFNVLPIDIAPASTDVYQCDFIRVRIGIETIFKSNQIEQLQAKSFHIIVFSLLLEYLPVPEQRLLCCKNAYELLKPEGVLVVITPDSKHVGANAKYMKCWRYALALLGFSRVRYEKLSHLHCMAFRKAVCCDVPRRWARLHESEFSTNTLHIPQDFNKSKSDESKLNSDLYVDHVDVSIDLFTELPFNED